MQYLIIEFLKEIYKMEYMSREDNHKFRKADNIINLHDIVISFNLFHILNIDVNHIKILTK